MDRFEYYITKYFNPKKKFKLKTCSAYFGDGAAQSQTGTVVVTSDCPQSPHQTAPPPQSHVGEHAHTSVQLPHPPKITSLNFFVDLVANPMGCDIHVLPQPLSLCSADPLHCTILCSSISDSTPLVNEDQDIDRVGVAQLTCIVIHEEYDWEHEHQLTAKDDSLLSTPPLFFPDIFGDSSILDFTCVSSSTDAPIVDHSQNTPDLIPSSDNGEDQSFFENLLDFSSTFSRNAEGEFFRFSSTPLFDSLDHEDANEIIDFVYHSCHGPFIPVFNHDVDSIVVYFSNPPTYDDIFVDEVETPQTVEALQP